MRHAIFALFVLLAAAKASACSCLGQPTVADEFEYADVVFAGVVTSIEDPRGDRLRALPEHERLAAQSEGLDGSWGPHYGRKVTFRVMQWWKTDNIAPSVEVWTGYGGGDCGYPVETGKSYVVYSRRDSRNQLGLGICGRTAALICASDDLEQLGEPIKTYETFDTKSLVKREEPYTTYWHTCIEPPKLISERGLDMDKHCYFRVDGVIGRDGIVRDFKIIDASPQQWCPNEARISEAVAKWKFEPATLNGEPIESRFKTVSMREPE